MTDHRQAIGEAAEETALGHLRENGLALLERNFRIRRGEIDLIMRENGEVVFVEVRARTASRYGDGADSITRGKRQRLVAAASAWLQRQPGEPPARFDVVSLTPDGHIDWIRDAFRADD